ncbi:hypothetical protein V8B55DRAFT_1435626 [Mucor lusitanicus]|uniref:Uncharacterized protein n=1 Tax=Mucor lusitanicus CBS 277.49 TaxID=747725 RepID=A0A168QDM6_MUCCL|nr:hypothetical protein MUCCIDRAFT_106072 [Mucor lusitanicus CBS 277.49]
MTCHPVMIHSILASSYLDYRYNQNEVSDLATIVDDIQENRKKLSIDAQLDLLLKAKTVGPVKAAVVRGIENLVVKLPTREVVDMDFIGETEQLRSAYFDPMLASSRTLGKYE